MIMNFKLDFLNFFFCFTLNLVTSVLNEIMITLSKKNLKTLAIIQSSLLHTWTMEKIITGKYSTGNRSPNHF